MKNLLVAALLAAAAPAFADGLTWKGPQPKPEQTAPTNVKPPLFHPPQTPTATPAATGNSDSAKRTVDVVEAELQASKVYLSALNDLAAKPTTWDKQSAIALFNDAQRSVTVAEEHLGKLEPLAKDGWARAADPLNRARASLVQTQGQLRTLAADVRSGTLTAADPSGLRSLWNSVDTAQKDMESAAGTMGVDFHMKNF